MTNDKVSVIVPIFNSAGTLHRCIDSILAQTYKNFELILINDGSTDGSLDICEHYAKYDDRIIVVNKKNGGVSSCRQLGLDMMTGQWLQFVDSDDWIESNLFYDNIQLISRYHVDIIVNDYWSDSGSKSSRKHQKHGSDLIDDIFQGCIFGALWNKFIRTQVVKDNEVGFSHGLNFCEDLVFLCELSKKSEGKLRLLMSNECYYHYCVNGESLTQKNSLKKVEAEELYISVIKDMLPSLSNKYLKINYVSILWGYLRHVSLPFDEYYKKSKLYLPLIKQFDRMNIKLLLFIISQFRLGYILVRKLLMLKSR